VLDAAAHGRYETRGSLNEWREGPAQLAIGHVLPVFAISASFAGPLLHLAGMESGGLHFFGPSSIGKTSLLALAASVWGRGDVHDGYVRTWRSTTNGLEGAAVGATDTALILDELGVIDAHELGLALYMLGNGSGKARAQRDGSAPEPKSWRDLTISSGELPSRAKLAEERGRCARAGQLVRMLDIPTQRAYGVFDNAGPDNDAANLAKRCRLEATSAFGTAGPEFVRRLMLLENPSDKVRPMVDNFVAKGCLRRADGQVVRAARRFGLVGAAGELATEFGLTGWREGEAWTAAEWACSQWIEGRGGIEPAEIRQVIERLRHFIEAYGDERFDNLDDPDAPRAHNRAGWRKGYGPERRWLVPSESWKQIFVGLDPKTAARVLAERGMIERGIDGFQPVRKIEGKPMRVSVVTPLIFDGGEL
jgi:uncharacterized protein (DUF927 family)